MVRVVVEHVSSSIEILDTFTRIILMIAGSLRSKNHSLNKFYSVV